MRHDRRRERPADGALIALWPLAMVIGVWGMGLIYRALVHGGRGLDVGVALVVGGGFLCSRWVAQARQFYRRAHRARQAAPPAGGR